MKKNADTSFLTPFFKSHSNVLPRSSSSVVPPVSSRSSLAIESIEADQAEIMFDNLAEKIIQKDFTVLRAPPRDVCRNCDFRYGCADRKRFYADLKV